MNLDVVLVLFEVVVLILAFSMHECAHAWAAWRLGDPTAKMMGRVTLNPAKHIDPLGSVLVPLIAMVYHLPLIGWAKPTPVTPRNFKNYRRDDILVTLAGPASNLLTAIVALILLIVFKHAIPNGADVVDRAIDIAFHATSATADLPSIFPIALFLYFSILINLSLFIFNLIPIPPLDGSNVLRHFLPYNALKIYDQLGMFSLILMMLVGGRIIGLFLFPILGAFERLLFAL